MVDRIVRRGRKYQKNRRCNVKREHPRHAFAGIRGPRGDPRKGKSRKYRRKRGI
jgi:hypothetical protein